MLKTYLRIVVAIFVLTILGVPVWITELMIYTGGALFVLKVIMEYREVNRVEKAVLISESAVYKKVAEKTGYSVDWGWKNGRDHYRYVDVIDHYICIFNVEFFNGETGTIKCKKNDYRYNKLIKKA